jgi:predicted RNase H-like HicB family nuclease
LFKDVKAVGAATEVSVMRSYIGLIHRAADSEFGVSFPDFPGVTAAGTNLDDARAVAQEALALHFASLAEDAAPIPEPSTLDQVMADANNRDGVAVLVCIKTEQSRAIRVNVTMPEDVLAQLDRYAETHGFTRSRLLTQAAKRLLAGAA